MAITLDNSAHTNWDAISTTQSFTISGSNTLLVVYLATDGEDVTNVTWDGTSLTHAVTSAVRNNNEMWYMTAPKTGTFNVVATLGAAGDAGMQIMSFNGAHQTSPLDATGGSGFSFATSESNSLTTVADNALIVSGLYLDSDEGINYFTATGVLDTEDYDGMFGSGAGDFSGTVAYKLDNGTAGAKTLGHSWADSKSGDTVYASFKPLPPTVEQEGYRWRDDDGSESGASWLANQDTDITRAVTTTTRLRVILNATNDPSAETYQLEYKKSTDSVYSKIE